MSLLATRHFQNNLGYFLAGAIRVYLKFKNNFSNFKLFFESRTLTKDFFFEKKSTETEPLS
jgi:hypothetical protein